MTRRGARYGLIGLLWRQFGSERAATATVAAVVLALSFLSAVAPRALDVIAGDEITASIAMLPATNRDLSATLLSAPTVGPSATGSATLPGDDALPADLDAVWGALDGALATIRDGLPPEAGATTSAGQFVAVTTAVRATVDELGSSEPYSDIAFLSDPRMADHVAIVEGSWPSEIPTTALDPAIDSNHGHALFAQIGTIEVILTPEAADRQHWEVGETRTVPIGGSDAQTVVLSGLFEPLDAESDYWQHLPTTLTAWLYDDGNLRPTMTSHGFVNPASWPALNQLRENTRGMLAQTRMWFPVDGDSITGTNAELALRQFRQTTSAVHLVGPVGSDDRVRFLTEAVDALDAVVSRSTATTSVLLMAASGPFAVAIAVLILAARLIAERRRPTLGLIAARGGSARQLRSVLALEGLAIGLPAALVGAGAAILLVPAEFAVASVLVPAVAGLAPAVVLAVAASPGSLRRTRTDLGASRDPRLRVAAEVAVFILAGLSVTLLLTRGIGAGSTGVDALLVSTPLLLALAATVAVLRVYPWPLAALERRLRERRSLVAFLGTARSLRDPAAGLAAVLAMVVALSVALFSSVILATLDAGVTRAAESTVGADLRASGPYFGDELVATVAAIPGVRAAVPVFASPAERLTLDREAIPVTVVYADLAALAGLQAGLADAAPAPAAASTDGSIPVVVSRSLLAAIDTADEQLLLNGSAVTVTSTADRIAGVGARGHWMLVDRAWSDEISANGFVPRVLLVGLETTGLDATGLETTGLDTTGDGTTATDDVRAAVAQAIGGGHAMVTLEETTSNLRASAFAVGLHTALVIVIVIVGLLAALAIVLVSTINAQARANTLAVLRVFGLSSRQSASLVLWELAPVAATAFVASAVLGVCLPLVVLAGVDLRAFTGGTVQPALAIDPGLTALVLGGFLLLAAATSAHAVITSRRLRIANTLRTGEQ